MNKPARIDVLDSVRGIAAMIVVIHHCFLTRPMYSDYFFSHWKIDASGAAAGIFLHSPARIVWAGYEAVTLFYVLSGLVLALPWLSERSPQYQAFAIKRMSRLYIPYVVAIVIAGLLNVLLLQSANVHAASRWVNEMTWTHPVSLSVIVDHLAIIGHHATINGVTHTLIWEIRVSLLFPLLILPIARKGVRGVLLVLGSLLAIIVAAQGLFGTFNQLGDLLTLVPHAGLAHMLAFEVQWTAYYACFFVLGSLLAAHLNEIRLLLTRAGGWAGFLLLLTGLLIFQGHWSQRHALQEIMVAIGSVMILCSALGPGPVETALLKPAPRYLGRISFSLYLVHVPVILLLTILTHGTLPLPVLILIVIPTSLLLAAIFDRLVTAPSADLGHRLARIRRRVMFAPRPIFE